ncbi:MAG: hypothetical protein ACLUN5_10830 [Oscillospiraceae bacterium]
MPFLQAHPEFSLEPFPVPDGLGPSATRAMPRSCRTNTRRTAFSSVS